jgi:hypothetical protein
MKKINFKAVGLSLLSSFFIGCVFGQSNEVAVSRQFATGKSSSTPASNVESKKLNPTISEKVSRSFLKNFKTAQTPAWSENNRNYVAEFYFEGRHALAWFKKSGLLGCTIYYGFEKDLPLREKKLINFNFPDYDITATQEIVYNSDHIWLVVVQNCKYIKKVMISNGSPEVIENITRCE